MAIAATASPEAIVAFLTRKPTWVRTKSRMAITPDLIAALFHVGGFSWRRSPAAGFLDSASVGRRPVRPRASTIPAAFPRCLVRRLRFVWAMTSEGRGSGVRQGPRERHRARPGEL